MKAFRFLVLSLLCFGGVRALVADDLGDELAGLAGVALKGNFDYPTRKLQMLRAQYPDEPRLARFAAMLAQARDREQGAPAGSVPADAASAAELTDFPRRSPRAGEPFSTEIARIGMIWIPAGKLLMTSVNGSDDDTLVTLSHGYWLGRTEVTQAQWAIVMENLPRPSRFRGASRPVEQISWVSAMGFCRKLTEAERAAGRVPPDYEYSLPTEAQWEFACRAGAVGRSVEVSAATAWCIVNSDRQTHPVAQKPPNAWGLYDLQGNVWEWCVDGYQGYPGGEVTDLRGDYLAPSAGEFRIARGGGWASPLGQCRPDYRTWNLMNATYASFGFRLALVPQASPTPGAAGRSSAPTRAVGMP